MILLKFIRRLVKKVIWLTEEVENMTKYIN